MKKIFIFLLLVIMISACGKKGDPVFEKQKAKVTSTKNIAVL